ncbi:MAG TPA: hypothetical protein VE057_17430 [Archangium sp.]|nr:hypothetical protein [Archangium sp.]
MLWVLAEDVHFGPGSDLLTTEALLKAFAGHPAVTQSLTTLRRLGMGADGVYVICRPFEPGDLSGARVAFDGASRARVDGFDVVFVRVDPPVTEPFRHALMLLGHVEEQGRVLFINSPRAICARGSKLLNLRFRDLLAPSLVTGALQEGLSFLRTQGAARWVAKPLDRASGTDVIRFSPDEGEQVLRRLLDVYGFIQLQEYLPEVERTGELRCLVFGGELVAAWRKVPAAGDFRANLDHGATVHPVEPAAAERLARPLMERLASLEPGFRFYSADFIGERLNELNVENVGGLSSADRLYGRDHAALILKRLLALASGAPRTASV